MFTRKHYKAVAEIIKKHYTSNSGADGTTATEQYVCRNIASDLAYYFEQNNSRFDRNKFMAACGLD